jgi:hypothetical protein
MAEETVNADNINVDDDTVKTIETVDIKKDIIIDREYFRVRVEYFEKNNDKEHTIQKAIKELDSKIVLRKFNVKTHDMIEIYDIQDDIVGYIREATRIINMALEYQKVSDIMAESFEYATKRLSDEYMNCGELRTLGLKNKEEKLAWINKHLLDTLGIDLHYYVSFAHKHQGKAERTQKQILNILNLLRGVEEQIVGKIKLLGLQQQMGALKSNQIYVVG